MSGLAFQRNWCLDSMPSGTSPFHPCSSDQAEALNWRYRSLLHLEALGRIPWWGFRQENIILVEICVTYVVGLFRYGYR